MKIMNKKLMLLAGLMTLTITSSAYGSTEGLAPVLPAVGQGQKPLGIDNCPVMKRYKGNDRRVEIIVDKFGNIYLDSHDKQKDFWHKDTLSWKILTTPFQRTAKGTGAEIEEYEIQFRTEIPDCALSPDAPQAWPCDPQGNKNNWKNGNSGKYKGNQKISCKIRPDGAPGHEGATKWDYCYDIKVTTKSGDIINVDPVGGGNGCGGCHLTEKIPQ